MKAGKSLVELAGELERQQASKRDFLADTRSLEMVDERLTIGNGTQEEVGITKNCHRQIGARIGIPKAYYDKMLEEAPILLEENVNHWFQSSPERRMVRTLDGNARAFLSDRYRPLDNFDLAEAVLPKIQEAGCEVKSSELTESRMYIQAVTPKLEAEVKQGDIVQAGIVVSNSEIGHGSVRIEPMIYRLACLNGMILRADQSMRKYHVGRRGGGEEFEGAAEMFKDSTRKLDDKAFWAKVCDVVDGSLNEIQFNEGVDQLRRATDQKIEGDPVKAVEEVSNRLTLTEGEGGSVLRHLVEGGDLSAYGMLNALTRTASDVEDYDRSVELERFGGRILELPKKDWELIAQAN